MYNSWESTWGSKVRPCGLPTATPTFLVKMAVLGSSLLGASTFCAKQHGADECDAKGLPLTLSTTNIIGGFQYLKGLRHPHLAVYLDAKKLKNGTSSGSR